MRLTYSILWFDDSESYFDSLDTGFLESVVSSWGFKLALTRVSSPDEFTRHAPFREYDLIVVDKNLDGYPDGEKFILDLRHQAVFTEVVFYTAGNIGVLWDEIRASELEGVFVCHRSNVLSKIEKVGLQSIRKVLDLENVRGIVMAEVGEIDQLIDQIVEQGIGRLSDDQRTRFFKKFVEGARDQHLKSQEGLEAFSGNPDVQSMILLCDSQKRWMNLRRLIKLSADLSSIECGDFEAEVLKPRNCLAHGRPEVDENGYHVFRYRNSSLVFNEEKSLEIRKRILMYKKTFESMLVKVAP